MKWLIGASNTFFVRSSLSGWRPPSKHIASSLGNNSYQILKMQLAREGHAETEIKRGTAARVTAKRTNRRVNVESAVFIRNLPWRKTKVSRDLRIVGVQSKHHGVATLPFFVCAFSERSFNGDMN